MGRLLAIAVVLVGAYYGCDYAKYERRIDASYYADKDNLLDDITVRNVGSLEACRDWAYTMAEANNDPDMMRGTYECGIDPLRNQPYPTVTVYRDTVQ